MPAALLLSPSRGTCTGARTSTRTDTCTGSRHRRIPATAARLSVLGLQLLLSKPEPKPKSLKLELLVLLCLLLLEKPGQQ